ncbi:MAG: hypothetical protein II902_11825, partial [Selenomonadaceae bacterium]|nr:hypothetical protein [Selenomonadaceae bacterium]
KIRKTESSLLMKWTAPHGGIGRNLSAWILSKLFRVSILTLYNRRKIFNAHDAASMQITYQYGKKLSE